MDRPNVLLIITDDQTFRSVDPWPDDPARSGMPNLLGYMTPGVEFTRAYVTTPQCGPSRATMMTGKYVHRHECWNNDHTTYRFKKNGHTRDHVALNLKAQGYTNGLFGKWMNGYEELPGHVPPGFDNWICTFRVRNRMLRNVDGKIKKAVLGQAEETAWTSNRIADFVSTTPAPWFCVASFNAPHAPYTPTLKNRAAYNGVMMPTIPSFDYYDPNKPRWMDNEKPLTQAQKDAITTEWRGKQEELLDVDDGLGVILSQVDFESTYVIYLSDNGYQLGEHRLRQKNQPYEESARVPFFVRGPGLLENSQVDKLVANVDLAPTIYELAGLDALAEACDGRSLLGPLVGAEDMEWRDALLLERYEGKTGGSGGIPGWRGVRTADELYVQWGTGAREMYDMAADPYQLANLIEDPDAPQSEEELALASRLTKMQTETGDSLRIAEHS